MSLNKKTSTALGVLSAAFLVLAAGFLVNPWGRSQARESIPPVDTNFLSTATVRQSYAELIRLNADLSDFDCYACHEKGTPPTIRVDTNQVIIIPKEHANLVMGHGSHNRNNNCFNCHDENNLEQFQTRDGRALKLSDSTPLCGSCHGPTYRDWEGGAHGRTGGFWNKASGETTRRNCVECHNPHAPKFPGRQPAPGPHLLHPVADTTDKTHPSHVDMALPEPNADGMNRRSFLRTSAVLTGGLAALAASLAPLREINDFPSVEKFLQKYYKEMTPEEMAKVLKRIENDVEKQFGLRPHVRDLRPMDGVEFVYALNLTRCIGCRKCVHACVAENNQSRNPEIQYIRVLKLPHGSLDLEKAEHNYDPEKVPEKGFFYMPVQCQQCKNPPCVKVCPVHATWQETDGITVIDYDWCIGCRYCEAACPYWARRFNFTKPEIPKEQLNLNMAYLGNRPRKQGVMEKCHFCIQRTRAGRYPACLEVCPVGARKFGNILDPNSEVSYILRTKRVFIQLKEEMGTSPRFFYYFDV